MTRVSWGHLMNLSGQRRAGAGRPFRPALRRARLGVVVLGMVASACGTTKHQAATPTPSPSPSLSPTPSSSPSPSPAPAAPAPTPSRRPTPSLPPSPRPVRTTAAPSPSPAAAASAPLGIPPAGTYTYALSGTTQTPLLGGQRPYPAGSTLSLIFADSPGGIVKATGTSAQDNASTTTTWTYGASSETIDDVTLTFIGIANYDCTFVPPPEILPNPLKVGALPAASFASSGCSGTVTVNVLDAETVTAAGQTWSVWRVQTDVHYVAQSSIDVTINSTSLVSAKIGTAVTSDTTTSGTVAGQPFSSHQVTALTSYP
jgi:hypothetical protein